MSNTIREVVSGGPDEERRPSCFGDPSRVCPKDDDGVIQPQVECVSCAVLRVCLQEALKREGLICDPAPQSQAISKATHFLKRWSHRKLTRPNREDAPDA